MPPPLPASIVRRSVTGVAVLSAVVAAAAAQAVATSPYVYGYGPQGLGYYLVPTAPAAVAAPPAAAAPAAPRLTVPAQPSRATSGGGSSVGPGVRNWATGNRVPSHRPWLRPRS